MPWCLLNYGERKYKTHRKYWSSHLIPLIKWPITLALNFSFCFQNPFYPKFNLRSLPTFASPSCEHNSRPPFRTAVIVLPLSIHICMYWWRFHHINNHCLLQPVRPLCYDNFFSQLPLVRFICYQCYVISLFPKFSTCLAISSIHPVIVSYSWNEIISLQFYCNCMRTSCHHQNPTGII